MIRAPEGYYTRDEWVDRGFTTTQAAKLGIKKYNGMIEFLYEYDQCEPLNGNKAAARRRAWAQCLFDNKTETNFMFVELIELYMLKAVRDGLMTQDEQGGFALTPAGVAHAEGMMKVGAK